MKKIIMALTATVILSAPAMAQNDQNQDHHKRMDKAEMVQHHTNRMVKDYGLNDQQAKQLLDLNTEYAGKLPMGLGRRFAQGHHGKGFQGRNRMQGDSLKKQVDGTTAATAQQRPHLSKEEMDKRHAEMKAQREEYDKKLSTIMTDEQFKKYQESVSKRMTRQGKPHDGKAKQ